MKRVFSLVSKIMLIVATVLFVVGIVVAGITLDAKDTAFSTAVMANTGTVICALIGVFLMSAKSDTAKRIGSGMTIATFTIALTLGLTLFDTSICAVLAVIAAGFLAFHYIFLLVVGILKRGAKDIDNPLEDARIVRLKEWKKILDEGMISQEEYEEKRVKILGLDK